MPPLCRVFNNPPDGRGHEEACDGSEHMRSACRSASSTERGRGRQRADQWLVLVHRARDLCRPHTNCWSYDEMMHTFYDNAGNATRISFTGAVSVTYTNRTT